MRLQHLCAGHPRARTSHGRITAHGIASGAVALERARNVLRARRAVARRATARIAVGLVARLRALRLLAVGDNGRAPDGRVARAPEELHADRPRSALITWAVVEQA